MEKLTKILIIFIVIIVGVLGIVGCILLKVLLSTTALITSPTQPITL
jgi:hypothetical protein